MGSITSDMTALNAGVLFDRVLNGRLTPAEKDKALEQLWECFGDITVDTDDNIDVDFLVWEKGTDRFDIWHWFDEEYSEGVAVLSGAADKGYNNENSEI
jgi:hypothetical protein